MSSLTPFHLAFPVHDLEAARSFYKDVIGCGQGRESDTWVDFDMFGHQVVAHIDPHIEAQSRIANAVDGDHVPVPHFGVVLPMEEWTALSARLKARGDIHWVIEPKIRFKGQPGEQATLFILDPSGNALEFKAFADMGQLFAS
jgi:extradiol dioxygenase family protein